MVGHGELTPGDNIGCDSPGLCDKIRFAKEHLVTNEYSSQTYRSTPKNQAIKAATVIKEAFQDKLLHYNSDARRVDAEANGMPTPEKEPHLSQSQKKPEVECLKHPSGNIERPAAGEKKPPQPPFSNHLGFPKTRAPSSSSSPHLGSAPQRFGPPPCIPLTSEEIALRARIIGTRNADKNQPKAEKLIPRVRPPPTPRPSYPTDSVRKSSSSTSTSAPRKPSNLRTVFSLENSQDTAVKMTQSDGSDEVVIPNRDRRRDNNKQARGTWRPNSAQNSRWPRRPKPEPFQEIGKQNGSHATNDRQYLNAPVTPTSNLHKGVSLANDNWADQHTPTPTPTPTPSTQKENHRTNQHEEEANELAQLRKQIVVNAHRRSNDPPPGAEMLSRCRDGPGTQLHSKEYRAITDIRTVPQEGILDSSYIPAHSQMLSTEIPEDADPEDLKRDMESQLRLCQELYRKSATAYPIVPDDKDEKIMLSTMPSAKQKDVLVKLQSPRREFAPQPIHLITGKKAVKTRWSDPKILDWEYCPAAIYDVKLYHERFQSWLENTIECARTVDIFHQAFFNGTAHADGQISMFMLDMRNHDVHLDPDDKESWSYAHESAAGYCCNIVLQNKKALEEQELRKQLERKRQFEAQQLQPPRTPTSPVANIYLRPVEPKDVPQLREIYNWYAGYSIDSPNTEDLDEDEVRQRVEDTRNANLPFIVAIDRRSASTDTEKILGYALAREFDRHHLAHQFTAELEVYVKDGHKRLGIGRCLLDKLLEVCDPTYVPKPGYRFEAKREDRSGYYGGGRRKLARLIFTLCYVDQKEITDHTNVKNWLREYAGFEEQGLLRGIRVKNGYLVNVAYLVRTIGEVNAIRLDP